MDHLTALKETDSLSGACAQRIECNVTKLTDDPLPLFSLQPCRGPLPPHPPHATPSVKALPAQGLWPAVPTTPTALSCALPGTIPAPPSAQRVSAGPVDTLQPCLSGLLFPAPTVVSEANSFAAVGRGSLVVWCLPRKNKSFSRQGGAHCVTSPPQDTEHMLNKYLLNWSKGFGLRTTTKKATRAVRSNSDSSSLASFPRPRKPWNTTRKHTPHTLLSPGGLDSTTWTRGRAYSPFHKGHPLWSEGLRTC